MRPIPVVAIVGRPNVGKSTLFNRLVGRRIAIEDPTAGTTRDRVSAVVEYDGRPFELIDTGGIGTVDREDLREEVEAQITVALEAADVVCLVVDVRQGLTPADEEIARTLRRRGVEPLLVVNKADIPRLEEERHDFWSLGLGDPLAVSAIEGVGRRKLLETILERLPAPAELEAEVAREAGAPLGVEAEPLKIAVVGKRNAGKSTFINAICEGDRVIVSEVGGTTRDAVDVWIERAGEPPFVLIDTAGLKRKKQVRDTIDLWSQMRTRNAIERADACLFVVDATHRLARIDKKIGGELRDGKKPTVILANKWDLSEGTDPEAYLEYLADRMPGLHFCPVVFTSALEGIQVEEAVDLAFELHEQAGVRVDTGPLNRVVRDVYATRKPRQRGGRLPKIYFATQVEVHPPTFVLFCNDPEGFRPSWRRFLENKLRETFAFGEVPLRMFFRERERMAPSERASG